MSWSRFSKQGMTLRLRLALYTSGLIALLCLELVIFINIITVLTHSQHLLAVSLIGLIINMIVGGLGAYWIAGKALLPVKEVSIAALQISASTLHTRLNLDGPQDELRELAQAFDGMLERLERAFELQSLFVADAAHELRTPLAILRTNLEVIGADSGATLEEYRALTVVLERTLRRLEHLVASLLVLASEERALVAEEVSLVSLLKDVVETLAPLAAEKNITVHLNVGDCVPIYGDQHLLELVFRNLIENALRYNRPDGSVTITSKNNHTSLLIQVSDTGIGIPEEARQRIFERFYRVDTSRSRHTGGAGLGLALVRHVLTLQKGCVWLEKSSPQGSVFVVELLKCKCYS